MEKSLVNIIVRTKDRPEFLMQALKSIAAQNYRPVKPVIVNDGGARPDEGSIRAALGDIEFAYVEHEVNRGRSAALNSGLRRVDGEFVYFLDDDDIVYPEGIESLVKAAGEERILPVYGRVACTRFTEDGEVIGTEIPFSPDTDVQGMEDSGGMDAHCNVDNSSCPEKDSGKLNHRGPVSHSGYVSFIGQEFDFGKLVFENYIPTNSLLVPSAILDEVGSFDEAFDIFEDWDWIIRMVRLYPPLFINTVVAEYRSFESSTLTGKGGADYHRQYKEMLLEKHSESITASMILDHVQRSVDTAVLGMDRAANINRDQAIKYRLESDHYHNETILLKDEIELYREDIEKYKKELSVHKDEILKHKEEIKLDREELGRLREELQRYQAHRDWQHANISRLEEALSGCRAHIDNCNAHIESVERRCSSIKGDLDSCILQSERLQYELSSKTVELDDAVNRIESIESERDSLYGRLSHAEEEFRRQDELLQSRETELENLGATCAAMRAELDLVYNSMSWRVTTPLRRGKAILTAAGKIFQSDPN